MTFSRPHEAARTGPMSVNPTLLDDPLDNASFVSEMRPALVKYFKRKTGNPAEAEDLAQDVLLSALTHPNWKTQDQAKGYIFRTAVNRWRDSLRRRRIRGPTIAWDEAAQRSNQNTREENPPERVLTVEEGPHQVWG